MNMNRLYLGIFFNLSPKLNYSGLFVPYSGHIEDTKSVEFASVANSPTFFHKMTGLKVFKPSVSSEIYP